MGNVSPSLNNAFFRSDVSDSFTALILERKLLKLRKMTAYDSADFLMTVHFFRSFF